MAHMPPQGWPQGGQFQNRPRVNASDFRHPHEIAASVGTIAVSIIILFVFGALINQLVAIIVPLVLTIAGVLLAGVAHKGHMVQVGPNQFPHLYRMANDIAYKLDMNVPHIYVKQSPVINAFASGFGSHRTVVFHSALLESMNEREIATVMAHEFGHIKCNHIIYLILQQLAAGGLMGSLMFMPLKWLFFYASRMAEFSADRAALIGTNDIQACVTSEIKLSVGANMFNQMNIQAYMQQIDEFNSSLASKFIEVIQDQTHPMTVNRILAVIRFYRSPEYQRLAAAHGKAGTSTLTAGNVGTRDLFHRVASKAEYERDVNVMQQGQQNRMLQQAAPPQQPQPAPYQQPAYPQQPFQQPQAAPSISCGNCGVPLEPYAKFCVRCGTPVAGTAPTAQPEAQQAPAPAPAPGPQPQVVRRVVRAGQPDAAPLATPAPMQQVPVAPAVQTPPPAPVAPAPSQNLCPSCKQAVEPGSKFCGNCGQAMH